MTDTNFNYELSYPVETMHWDGQCIHAVNHDDIARRLDILASLGIKWVMLAGYHVDEPSSFDPELETVAIGKMLEQRGMSTAQHHAVAASFAPLGTSQKRVVSAMRKCIDFTAKVRGKTVVIHAGKFAGLSAVNVNAVMFRSQVEEHGLDAVIDTAAVNWRQAGEYASQRGVTIALENIDGAEPLCDLDTLPDLLRRIDLPSVGFCLDTGHAWCAGVSITSWLDKLSHKLLTTHIHDNNGVPGQTPEEIYKPEGGFRGDQHLPPGFGTIPWCTVIQQLWQHSYDNILNFESGPWPGLPLADGYQAAINYWRTAEYYAQNSLNNK